MTAACVIGDSDSHGGAITSGSSRTTVNGKIVAIIGSSVSPDPRKNHNGKSIVSSNTSSRTTSNGIPIVCSGGGVSCGAQVIASNSRTTCV